MNAAVGTSSTRGASRSTSEIPKKKPLQGKQSLVPGRRTDGGPLRPRPREGRRSGMELGRSSAIGIRGVSKYLVNGYVSGPARHYGYDYSKIAARTGSLSDAKNGRPGSAQPRWIPPKRSDSDGAVTHRVRRWWAQTIASMKLRRDVDLFNRGAWTSRGESSGAVVSSNDYAGHSWIAFDVTGLPRGNSSGRAQ